LLDTPLDPSAGVRSRAGFATSFCIHLIRLSMRVATRRRRGVFGTIGQTT
jgi:hypothetical protein